ncbi:hypothetical protein ACJRO7_034589 [Eucalyptus globulus]|uniref:Uncharacterized protein n=1 Tax=Eucalyptus globulus TaxID=34317 RepID=A0ABD3J3D1_EUCGL
MERPEDEMTGSVPTWLERMFAASKFYDPCDCKDRCSKPAKYYCMACMIVVCEDGMEQHHKSSGHSILTAYKSSGVAAFRIEDLKQVWCWSGIQRYTINRRAIVYVNQKGGAHRTGSSNGDAKCGTCQYKILAPNNFCSVECKVKAVLKKIEVKEEEEALNRAKRKLETTDSESPSDAPKNVAAGVSFRKRPRKQSNPQRAPLF